MAIIQRTKQKKRSEAKVKKAKEVQENTPLIMQTKLSEEDQKIIDTIGSKLEDDNINISNTDKQLILSLITQSTISYKKDNSVYKELVPKNFSVPETVGTKIRMLREEMLEAAEDKEIGRFILTQGLLLRAMIESTTTTYLRKYWEEASKNDLIINHNEKVRKLSNVSDVDGLAFATKYQTMIRLLAYHGLISNQRVDSLIQEFHNVQVNRQLNLLMHDSQNFPQFQTLKQIWNCVAPQLLLVFDKIK